MDSFTNKVSPEELKEISYLSKAVKKILLSKATENGSIARQVVRERQALVCIESQKDHCPYLVRLFATYKNESNLYFVLEHISGGDLYKHIRSSSSYGLSLNYTKYYCSQIIQAVKHLHKYRIIHRDIKANNVILTKNGYVKLIDLGNSKLLSNDQNFTTTILGISHSYAPEIVQKKPHNFGADWWSLGILTFEMLAGEPPIPYYCDGAAVVNFDAQSQIKNRLKTIWSKIAKVDRNNQDICDAENFIITTLQQDPNRRSPSKNPQGWFSEAAKNSQADLPLPTNLKTEEQVNAQKIETKVATVDPFIGF